MRLSVSPPMLTKRSGRRTFSCEAIVAKPGTLENIALMLGQSLQPLADELQPDRAFGFLSQLGLSLPQTALTQQLRSAFGSGASAAAELPALIGDLVTSIELDAEGLEIASKSVPLVAKLIVVIDAFATIADELSSVNVPGLDPAALNTFVSELPARLLEFLFVANLRIRQPTFASVLGLIGIIDIRRENEGSFDPFRPARCFTGRLPWNLREHKATRQSSYWSRHTIDATYGARVMPYRDVEVKPVRSRYSMTYFSILNGFGAEPGGNARISRPTASSPAAAAPSLRQKLSEIS